MLWANRTRMNRTTTGNRRGGQDLWVYGRAGEPCRRCGTPDTTSGVLRRRPSHLLVSVVPAVIGSTGGWESLAISSATSSSRLLMVERSIRTDLISDARYSVDSTGPRPFG